MLINPRLTEAYGIDVAQHDIDFAIPFLDEDIPLYLDPFMLWRSPSMQDKSLHLMLLGAFNHLGQLSAEGRRDEAVRQLITASECEEVGLGGAADRRGRRIGAATASKILDLFKDIPAISQRGFRHIEEVQLFVEGISRDRISDFACSFLKSFLVDYTFEQSEKVGLPLREVILESVYDASRQDFSQQAVKLPVHPQTGAPIVFVPKRWLRHVPWISFESYFSDYCPQDEIAQTPEELTRVAVTTYNRDNYGVVDAYIQAKERTSADCVNDPLFSQIPVLSARRQVAKLKKLATGKDGGADADYEKIIGTLLPSLLYPDMDFAAVQSRTESGVSIRDLIFYNTRRHGFLQEIFSDYGSRQIVMEMKNVAAVERTHVDQINRYLADELGRFGVLITRHPTNRAVTKRIVDLWAGQRKAVVTLTDADIEQMVELFESKQRDPIDVLIKKYVELRRLCP